jgi:hypothetical protein
LLLWRRDRYPRCGTTRSRRPSRNGGGMKFAAERPYANPEAAARKLKIANSVEAVQDVRIYIEKINWPLAIARGWLATR